MTVRKFLELLKLDTSQVPKKLLNKQKMKIRVDEAALIADQVGYNLIDFVEAVIDQRCRLCGCTNHNCYECMQKTGSPCRWIEEDLCSACISENSPAKSHA